MRAQPKGIVAERNKVDPELRAAIRGAIKDSRYPVLLHGSVGCGKTSAMACLYQIVRGGAIWFRAVEFIQLIQSCRRNGSVMLPGSSYECGEPTLWRTRVEQPDWLFIDDIGIRSPSGPQYEVLYELFDRRGEKPSFYSSNLSPGQLEKLYDARIASRISRGTVIELVGDDQRMQGRKNYKIKVQ